MPILTDIVTQCIKSAQRSPVNRSTQEGVGRSRARGRSNRAERRKIGGGGIYDDLTSNFGLTDVSGVGISFGIDRIYLVMEQLGLFPSNISIIYCYAKFTTSGACFSKQDANTRICTQVTCAGIPPLQLGTAGWFVDQTEVRQIWDILPHHFTRTRSKIIFDHERQTRIISDRVSRGQRRSRINISHNISSFLPM